MLIFFLLPPMMYLQAPARAEYERKKISMSNNTLLSFPANEIEALAMLYVQQQDISGLSPEELLDIYQKAYDKIKTYHRETCQERHHLGWSIE